MPGIFSALMGGMPEGYFHFPQQLPQKVENSPLYGLLPGAGGLLTDPLTPGALPQGGAPRRANCPIRKSPALTLECRGFFIHLQLLYRGSLQLVDHTDFRCDTQVAGRRKGGIGKAAVLCLLAHQRRSAIGALLHRDHIAQGASGCFRHLLS